MPYQDPTSEPRLLTRRDPHTEPHAVAATLLPPEPGPGPPREPTVPRLLRLAVLLLSGLALFSIAGYVYARHWIRAAANDALPQLDGQLSVPGLSAPVTVTRDPHGVPALHARTLDDLVLAQGYITASDRLFQMDTLRRHAAGTLAEILGPSVLGHDRLQRTLQIRAAADRAVAALPPGQLHLLDQYARGVNASIAAQHGHLPVEFRVLRYTPAPWAPRDSILVALAMFQDLTNAFPTKLARESLSQRLPADLLQDLYPTGSWRDHPPSTGIPDLTIPGPPIEQVPLDESQAALTHPGAEERGSGGSSSDGGSSGTAGSEKRRSQQNSWGQVSPTPATIIATLQPLLHPEDPDPCALRPDPCFTPGSNAWAVSGAHTASGKPLLSNDMHLNLTLPGIWYENDLQADETNFHTAGVSIPGAPLICVGHNQSIAWGFTNLGADVQDVYLESTRGTGSQQEFLAADGSWQPVLHLSEPIIVKGARSEDFEVLATRHGDSITPILNPTVLPSVRANRTLSLRWTIYDPANLTFPWLAINSAHDWPTFLAAFSTFGGPAQNVLFADSAGHIGYHAVGRIPLRGPAPTPVTNPATLPPDLQAPDLNTTANTTPRDLQAPPVPNTPQLSGPLSPVAIAPSPAHEWSGYIPFDQLPQVLDPPSGILATANSRITPDDYPYPITLNWASPYRNERIWRTLAGSKNLTAADMLALQNDVYSDLDHVLAQRLAYALDHSTRAFAAKQQAADLLRTFNGRMYTTSAAASIVASVRDHLWPLLLSPHLDGRSSTLPSREPNPAQAALTHPAAPLPQPEINTIYLWQSRDYALEQILLHTPARWLPPGYSTWEDFLAAAVDQSLTASKAPADLSRWTYGQIHITDIEHPIFDQSPLLRRLLGLPTGTGPHPQSGDNTTIKQVGKAFGPSERFTADLANPDASTLNLPFGQSADPASPWFLDQFDAWLHGATYPFPFTIQTATHTLTLNPR